MMHRIASKWRLPEAVSRSSRKWGVHTGFASALGAEPAKQPDTTWTLAAKVLEYSDKLQESKDKLLASQREYSDKLQESKDKLLASQREYSDKLLAYSDELRAVSLKAEKDAERLRFANSKLMGVSGLLSMRGVFDYIYKMWDDKEEQERGSRKIPRDRVQQWTAFLEENPQLRVCIELHAKTRLRDAGKAAEYVVGMYRRLSDRIHDNRAPAEYEQANGRVRIVDGGALDRKQCRALKCICDEFKFPAEIVFESKIDDSSASDEA